MITTRKYHVLLRQIRLEARMTQVQVAERIGETQSYVSKYESGEQRLDLYELERICNAIEMPLLEFIGRYLET